LYFCKTTKGGGGRGNDQTKKEKVKWQTDVERENI
jgi:hypothetical protein